MPVPIIGQTASVILWYPTAIIGCRCKGENHVALIPITGFGNAVQCANCNKLYVATGIRENPDKLVGGYILDIDVLAAPGKTVM